MAANCRMRVTPGRTGCLEVEQAVDFVAQDVGIAGFGEDDVEPGAPSLIEASRVGMSGDRDERSGRRVAPGAQLPRDVDAPEFRELEIEDDQIRTTVRSAGDRKPQGGQSVGSRHDLEPARHQEQASHFEHIGIVIDEKYSRWRDDFHRVRTT